MMSCALPQHSAGKALPFWRGLINQIRGCTLNIGGAAANQKDKRDR